MNSTLLILKINQSPMYIDTDFVRTIFTKLKLGTISNIQTEFGFNSIRTDKGSKKIYYKNIYISFSGIFEDKAIIKKMFDQFTNESHLIVHYSTDDYWKVYKCDELPNFKPMISFPIKTLIQ